MAAKRKTAEAKALPPSGTSDEELIELLGLNVKGGSITGERALGVPVVFGAVRLLAESIAGLPCMFYRRGKDGGKERATDDPRYGLLHGRPNAWTPAPEFFERLIVDALVGGSGFALATRLPSSGAVRELRWIPRTAVTFEEPIGEEPVYRITSKAGVQKVLSRRDVVHVRVAGGRGIIKPAKETIGLLHGLNAYMNSLVAGGGRPSGILEGAASLTDTARKNLKSVLDSADGMSTFGKTLMLPDGVKYHQQQFSSVDMQVIEIWRRKILDFCQVAKIPPFMLGDLSGSTYNNSAEAGRVFLQMSLQPIIELLQGALEVVLIDEDEQDLFFVEFLVDAIVQSNIALRFQGYQRAVGGPWLTPNEARALENRPPVEGGDTLIRPVNMAPVGADPNNQEPSNGQ